MAMTGAEALIQQGYEQAKKESMTGAEALIQQGIEQGIEQGYEKAKKEAMTGAEALIQQGLEKGIEQGKIEAAKENTIDNILLVLDTRFQGKTAQILRPKLESIDDIQFLNQLVRVATVTQSLDAFIGEIILPN